MAKSTICPDCGKSKDSRATYCKQCASKGKRNSFWGKKHSAETRAKLLAAWEGRHEKLDAEKLRRQAEFPFCECGCGSQVKRAKNRFITGHNARLMVGDKRSGGMTGKQHSAATREKMSSSKMGKKHSPETRRKLSIAMTGRNNPNYGKPKSPETKRKMSLARKGRVVPKEVRQKLSAALKGENSPNWNGGSSFEPYGLDFNSTLKFRIRERDNFICQLCSRAEKEELRERGQVLCIHHIDYDKKNNIESNLITLCNSCNSKVNSNRGYWQSFFGQKLFVQEFLRAAHYEMSKLR